jgi:hypothetical protein
VKFKVSIPETHYATIIVEAETEEKAKENAFNVYFEGDWDYFPQVDVEFSHMDPDKEKWQVETVK